MKEAHRKWLVRAQNYGDKKTDQIIVRSMIRNGTEQNWGNVALEKEAQQNIEEFDQI